MTPRKSHKRIVAKFEDQGNYQVFDSEPTEIDPLTGYIATVRKIQPVQANKTYICPECNDEIQKGTLHLVVVPTEAPDLRRHWHSYCWVRRQNRLPPTKRKRPKAK